MRHLFFCLLATIILGFTNSQAQQVYPCHASQMVEKALAAEPWRRADVARLERETAAYVAARSSGRVASDTATIIIPVVFHVIHNNGPENISLAQIESEIIAINTNYRNKRRDTNLVSAPYRPLLQDSKIEFRLARKDPQGNCTNGVVRVQSALTVGGGDNVKGLSRWPSNKYLNIWTVKSLATAGVAAYAYYPGTVGPDLQGIVSGHVFVGNIGTSQDSDPTTITHEIGHYLNLSHPWGNSNEPGLPSNCSIDDGVADTPNTIGSINFVCNRNLRTCDPNSPRPDNVENFMDYNTCPRMFTPGQFLRIQAALASSVSARNNLGTPANLAATGVSQAANEPPCAPQITTSAFQSIKFCQGDSARITLPISNLASTDSIAYRWFFPGGTPSSSTKANPYVFYPASGAYPASLRVIGRTGTDSVSIPAAFFIRSNQAFYLPGDSELFVTPRFPQVGGPFKAWQYDSPDTNRGWRAIRGIGFQDQNSIRVIPSQSPASTEHSIISPAYDMSTATATATLNFRLAAGRPNSASNDILTISASTNCGKTWQSFFRRNSTTTPSLYSRSNTANFLPITSDWQQIRFPISSYAGRANVRFKFEISTGGGSGIFIDNLSVDAGLVANSSSLAKQTKVYIFPNPATSSLTVALPFQPSTSGTIFRISDLSGRMLSQGALLQSTSIIGTSTLPRGIYLLQIAGQPAPLRFILQ